MSKNRALMIISDDIQNINQVKWDKMDSTDFLLKINTGSIDNIKIISKSVVEIKFKTVTLIFDITEEELKKIKWED
jgi:hypothetical protein